MIIGRPEMQTKMLIGGDLVVGAAEAIEVFDPATGEVLASVAESDASQVDRAVAAASRAFEQWSRTTPRARSLALLKAADRLEASGQAFALVESQNCGKPLARVVADEIPATVDVLRFFAGAARCLTGAVANEYLPQHTSMIRRDPIGVIGAIVPWNYPLMTAVWKLAPVLAAGNTLVLKPSELTPLTTLMLGELLADLFPPGVFNVVHGRGETTGRALATHPTVRMLSLTGSIETGKLILDAASRSLMRTHLELGGKAPVIVFDDADIDALVQNVRMSGYYNAGQDCTAACCLYVEEGVYERVVAELANAVATIRCGAPTAPDTEMGPLVSVLHRDRVMGLIDRAVAEPHMKVLCGGAARGGAGYYLEPTLIAGATPEDEIVRREVFGPVVTVGRFRGVEQALDYANRSQYGLASSVWSNDGAKAMYVASRLQYGCTWINTHLTLASEMPHGGMKMSGYGKDLSMYALEEYTLARHVMVKLCG
jgi:aminobutyraldehyde dehydrogenase